MYYKNRRDNNNIKKYIQINEGSSNIKQLINETPRDINSHFSYVIYYLNNNLNLNKTEIEKYKNKFNDILKSEVENLENHENHDNHENLLDIYYNNINNPEYLSNYTKDKLEKYIEMVNEIKEIDIKYNKKFEKYSKIVCIICNSKIEDRKCDLCGYVNNIYKNKQYTGSDKYYKKDCGAMKKYLRQLIGSINNADSEYKKKLDDYFEGINMLIGFEVSKQFSTNNEKINNNYNIKVLYNALLKCKINNPTKSIYYYLLQYWNWDICSIDYDDIDLCNKRYNILQNYMIIENINVKINISFCAWFMLCDIGYRVSFRDNYKQNKTKKIKEEIKWYNILKKFSDKYEYLYSDKIY